MHIVLSEIYEASGKNSKYIPVVFNSKTCKIDHVPQLLKTYTIFTMERDLKKLQYRIWDKEMYKLAPLPKNPPILKQIVIGWYVIVKETHSNSWYFCNAVYEGISTPFRHINLFVQTFVTSMQFTLQMIDVFSMLMK